MMNYDNPGDSDLYLPHDDHENYSHVYIPPYHSIHYKERDAIFAQLNLWLDKARSNNYHVVILGDFNADKLSHSHLPQHHLKILRSLSSRYFTDHQSYISSILGPSPTFYHLNGSSRFDYIWLSPGFPAPGLFSQVESCPMLNDHQFTDHCGAIDSLPFQHVSNTHYHKYPPELTMLIAINKFLDRLLFKLTTSRPSRPAQISQMTNSLPTQLILLKSLLTDYTIPSYNSIEYYTALRDEHFSTSLGSFIYSALSVKHRSIVLDRVLVVIDSKPTLLTDPSDIKQAAIKHFQSVVTSLLVQYSSTDLFPPRWKRAYIPLSDIDSSLYNLVMSPILDE
ncbi:hypothetical protein GLOIN_2v1770668 [Rhizophagus irregularis DAOM 181602=DAOM 197198]|nr:hypothetical protein GLOIN_2v1770668 [Rhizophagus irregularis DAOM 181602=DAOM 197198]